jgi:hypothetical protein
VSFREGDDESTPLKYASSAAVADPPRNITDGCGGGDLAASAGGDNGALIPLRLVLSIGEGGNGLSSVGEESDIVESGGGAAAAADGAASIDTKVDVSDDGGATDDILGVIISSGRISNVASSRLVSAISDNRVGGCPPSPSSPPCAW